MRDPEMVSRANAAAVTLERAWERWRIMHGLPATARSPVSSYVGYSIEEPWGSPRVVFGVDAGEAELLAALLERHECGGQDYQPGPPARVLDQPGLAGDALFQATRARLADQERARPVAPLAPAAPQFAAASGLPPAQLPAQATDAGPSSDPRAPGELSPAQDMEIPGQGSLMPEPAGALADAAHPAGSGQPADGGQPAGASQPASGASAGGVASLDSTAAATPGGGAGTGDSAAGRDPRAAVADESADSHDGEPAASGRAARGEQLAREETLAAAGPSIGDGRGGSADRNGSVDRRGNGDRAGNGDRGRQGRNRDAAARTGRGKGGTETIAAELAGWASGELPGQASARLAAWEAIGGVPAADAREGSATSLHAAGLGSPLDAPELGAADLGTTAEPVR